MLCEYRAFTSVGLGMLFAQEVAFFVITILVDMAMHRHGLRMVRDDKVLHSTSPIQNDITTDEAFFNTSY